MNKELHSIIRNIENVNSGTPWFGRSVYELLEEIDKSVVYKKPNDSSHSLIELLYHMNTWADFTLKRIKGDRIQDMEAYEKMDWREIDPKTHDWQKGLKEFKKIHQDLVAELQTKDDEFLKEKVDYREYNVRFLLNGLIQHNIYHIGQIAYLMKLLD